MRKHRKRLGGAAGAGGGGADGVGTAGDAVNRTLVLVWLGL